VLFPLWFRVRVGSEHKCLVWQVMEVELFVRVGLLCMLADWPVAGSGVCICDVAMHPQLMHVAVIVIWARLEGSHWQSCFAMQ
jgi:hypothetical protein